MAGLSPTWEGFRVALRRPSLTLGEITWRWAVGATAIVLVFFGLFEYLNTLPVTNGELLFLRTRQPYLVMQAILHILRGSLQRGLLSLLLAALLLAVLWMIAASLGRIATVGAMLDYVREQLARRVSALGITPVSESSETSPISASPLRALLRLNFLRVSLSVAAIVGLVGAATLAGFASSDKNPQPGLVFFLFLPLAGAICVVALGLNWLLSLAAMFSVRDGEDAVSSISAAVALCCDRPAAVFAVSTWTGLAHLVAFVGATTVVSVPLGFAGFIPWRLIVLGMLLITLVYFAVADWLYTARLAGYVCIAEIPDALLAPPPLPPLPQPITPPATIDRDELILSDVPSPVIG